MANIYTSSRVVRLINSIREAGQLVDEVEQDESIPYKVNFEEALSIILNDEYTKGGQESVSKYLKQIADKL